MRSSVIWLLIGVGVFAAFCGAYLESKKTLDTVHPLVPLPIVRESRAAGFTVRGEVVPEMDLRSGNTRVKSAIWATGKTFANEVILMEGGSTLVKPDGSTKVFGKNAWTFGDRLESALLVPKTSKGSVVHIQGQLRVFRREDIKVEREILPDGAVKLYMNTGTVVFRKIPNTTPPQMEVICENLGAVHQHGMDLLGLDKKTVTGRILLQPGRQVIERENYPYFSKLSGMLPIFIWQLIPKRTEPINMTLEVPETTVPKS